MAIVSSSITLDAPQANGSRRVMERHVDHTGAPYVISYLCGAGFDAAAALAARAASLVSDISATEISANIAAITTFGSLATLAMVHSTIAQNIAALRAAYRDADRHQAVYIGDWLSARTDAQLQAAFGLTAAQVTTLRTNRLTPAANAAATLRATTGA